MIGEKTKKSKYEGWVYVDANSHYYINSSDLSKADASQQCINGHQLQWLSTRDA